MENIINANHFEKEKNCFIGKKRKNDINENIQKKYSKNKNNNNIIGHNKIRYHSDQEIDYNDNQKCIEEIQKKKTSQDK